MVSLGGLEPPISDFAGLRLFHLDHRDIFLAHGERCWYCPSLVFLVREVHIFPAHRPYYPAINPAISAGSWSPLSELH